MMSFRITRKMKILAKGKLIIQPKIATLMHSYELIILNHGSKELLAKKYSEILGTSGLVLLKWMLVMFSNLW